MKRYGAVNHVLLFALICGAVQSIAPMSVQALAPADICGTQRCFAGFLSPSGDSSLGILQQTLAGTMEEEAPALPQLPTLLAAGVGGARLMPFPGLEAAALSQVELLLSMSLHLPAAAAPVLWEDFTAGALSAGSQPPFHAHAPPALV